MLRVYLLVAGPRCRSLPRSGLRLRWWAGLNYEAPGKPSGKFREAPESSGRSGEAVGGPGSSGRPREVPGSSEKLREAPGKLRKPPGSSRRAPGEPRTAPGSSGKAPGSPGRLREAPGGPGRPRRAIFGSILGPPAGANHDVILLKSGFARGPKQGTYLLECVEGLWLTVWGSHSL